METPLALGQVTPMSAPPAQGGAPAGDVVGPAAAGGRFDGAPADPDETAKLFDHYSEPTTPLPAAPADACAEIDRRKEDKKQAVAKNIEDKGKKIGDDAKADKPKPAAVAPAAAPVQPQRPAPPAAATPKDAPADAPKDATPAGLAAEVDAAVDKERRELTESRDKALIDLDRDIDKKRADLERQAAADDAKAAAALSAAVQRISAQAKADETKITTDYQAQIQALSAKNKTDTTANTVTGDANASVAIGKGEGDAARVIAEGNTKADDIVHKAKDKAKELRDAAAEKAEQAKQDAAAAAAKAKEGRSVLHPIDFVKKTVAAHDESKAGSVKSEEISSAASGDADDVLSQANTDAAEARKTAADDAEKIRADAKQKAADFKSSAAKLNAQLATELATQIGQRTSVMAGALKQVETTSKSGQDKAKADDDRAKNQRRADVARAETELAAEKPKLRDKLDGEIVQKTAALEAKAKQTKAQIAAAGPNGAAAMEKVVAQTVRSIDDSSTQLDKTAAAEEKRAEHDVDAKAAKEMGELTKQGQTAVALIEKDAADAKAKVEVAAKTARAIQDKIAADGNARYDAMEGQAQGILAKKLVATVTDNRLVDASLKEVDQIATDSEKAMTEKVAKSEQHMDAIRAKSTDKVLEEDRLAKEAQGEIGVFGLFTDKEKTLADMDKMGPDGMLLMKGRMGENYEKRLGRAFDDKEMKEAKAYESGDPDRIAAAQIDRAREQMKTGQDPGDAKERIAKATQGLLDRGDPKAIQEVENQSGLRLSTIAKDAGVATDRLDEIKKKETRDIAVDDKKMDALRKDAAKMDAVKKRVATLAGAMQWKIGASQGKAFEALEGMSPEEIVVFKEEYKEHYAKDGQSLDDVLEQKLSGKDLKEAKAALSGDKALATAAALENCLTGVVADTAKARKILGDIDDPKARKEAIDRFEKESGHKLDQFIKDKTTGADRDVLESSLIADNDKRTAEVASALAYESTHPGALSWVQDKIGDRLGDLTGETDEQRRERRKAADKYDLMRQASNLGTNKEGLYDALKMCKTDEQRRQLKEAYKRDHGVELEDEVRDELDDVASLTSDDADAGLALLKGDTKGYVAHRIKGDQVTWTGMAKDMVKREWDRDAALVHGDFDGAAAVDRRPLDGVDSEAMLKHLKEIPPDQREEYDSDFKTRFGYSVKDFVDANLKGSDKDRADTYIDTGEEAKWARAKAAMEGFGTNKGELKDVLKSFKTKKDLDAFLDEYKEHNGGRSLEADLADEKGLSPQDKFDFGLMVEGPPETPEDKIARIRKIHDFERNESTLNLSPAALTDPMSAINVRKLTSDTLSNTGDQLDKRMAEVDDIEKQLKSKDLSDEDKAALEKKLDTTLTYFGYETDNFREHADTIANTTAEYAATATKIGVNAVGGGPQLAELAGGAVEIGIKAKMRGGHSYGLTDMGLDAAKTAVNVATAGIDNPLVAGALGGGLNGVLTEDSLRSFDTFVDNGLSGAKAGALTGVASAGMQELGAGMGVKNPVALAALGGLGDRLGSAETYTTPGSEWGTTFVKGMALSTAQNYAQGHGHASEHVTTPHETTAPHDETATAPHDETTTAPHGETTTAPHDGTNGPHDADAPPIQPMPVLGVDDHTRVSVGKDGHAVDAFDPALAQRAAEYAEGGIPYEAALEKARRDAEAARAPEGPAKPPEAPAVPPEAPARPTTFGDVSQRAGGREVKSAEGVSARAGNEQVTLKFPDDMPIDQRRALAAEAMAKLGFPPQASLGTIDLTDPAVSFRPELARVGGAEAIDAAGRLYDGAKVRDGEAANLTRTEENVRQAMAEGEAGQVKNANDRGALEGQCAKDSVAWQNALAQQGMFLPIVNVNEFHRYLTDGKGMIVDPTFGQFFGGKPVDLGGKNQFEPFVGTYAEMKARVQAAIDAGVMDGVPPGSDATKVIADNWGIHPEGRSGMKLGDNVTPFKQDIVNAHQKQWADGGGFAGERRPELAAQGKDVRLGGEESFGDVSAEVGLDAPRPPESRAEWKPPIAGEGMSPETTLERHQQDVADRVAEIRAKDPTKSEGEAQREARAAALDSVQERPPEVVKLDRDVNERAEKLRADEPALSDREAVRRARNEVLASMHDETPGRLALVTEQVSSAIQSGDGAGLLDALGGIHDPEQRRQMIMDLRRQNDGKSFDEILAGLPRDAAAEAQGRLRDLRATPERLAEVAALQSAQDEARKAADGAMQRAKDNPGDRDARLAADKARWALDHATQAFMDRTIDVYGIDDSGATPRDGQVRTGLELPRGSVGPAPETGTGDATALPNGRVVAWESAKRLIYDDKGNMRSPAMVAAALAHEMVHIEQLGDGTFTKNGKADARDVGTAINEAEAYSYMLREGDQFGLNDADRQIAKDQLGRQIEALRSHSPRDPIPLDGPLPEGVDPVIGEALREAMRKNPRGDGGEDEVYDPNAASGKDFDPEALGRVLRGDFSTEYHEHVDGTEGEGKQVRLGDDASDGASGGPYGDSPETDAIHDADRRRAGMNQPPQHHVIPQEFRRMLRGLGLDLDIDAYTVTEPGASHEAQHGGGNYRLGRQLGFEWNVTFEDRLAQAAAAAGGVISNGLVVEVAQRLMAERGVNAPFERYRTRPDQATGQEGWDQTDGAEYGDLDARIQRPDDDDGEPASTHAPPSEPEPDDRYARMDRG